MLTPAEFQKRVAAASQEAPAAEPKSEERGVHASFPRSGIQPVLQRGLDGRQSNSATIRFGAIRR